MPDLLERLRTALADCYTVESEIGRGGMAVVYLAQDLRHDRRVAIKVLLPELTATLGGERFLQEIKTVASLQHPHILPLYDSGEAGGLLYYVMPYAEGESLRQRLDREKQLAVDESVRIAVEVADGLDYAHRKGVVHRDIKPGNILLSERHAVIADFGIARAIEVARADRVTSTGLGVGTPLYASPEQATAQETLDGRTDIYSLGCVLYEMLAGQPPLTGATSQIIQARRVSETPSPLHNLRDTVPPALDHVIARALARIPADRYATASQFGQALQAAIFTATPAAMANLAATPADLSMTPTTIAPEPKRMVPGWVLFAVSILGIAVVMAGVTMVLSSGWPGGELLQITTSNNVQVTLDPGLEFQPAISPDGSEVAYVEDPIGDPRIVVRSAVDVGSGGESRPGEEVGGHHWLPEWTTDGASIRFLACPLGLGPNCDWREVGSRGGSIRPVTVPRRSDRYAWSRDGGHVAFAVQDSIFAYTEEAGEPQLLGVQDWSPHSLTWSPDGRWIAFVNGNHLWRTRANVLDVSIWILDADGGEAIRVTDQESMNVSPQWLPDSRHLLFVSNRDGARTVYVVEVGPKGAVGAPRSVPGPSDPHSISISADGKKLAYSKYTVAQNIMSIPVPEAGVVSVSEAVPITTGNQIIEGTSLSPDGEWIVYAADRRGELDLYKQRLDGGSPQLVADINGDAFQPEWSPDGTEIVFYDMDSAARNNLLVVPAEGGTPIRLWEDPGLDYWSPAWSPDGLSIAFMTVGPVVWIASRPAIGRPWGDPVELTGACGWPRWAPDGASLLCQAGGGEWARVSRNGEVLSRYDSSTTGLPRLRGLKFSPDASRIYIVGEHQDGSDGVWWIPADGGSATKIVSVDDPSLGVHPRFGVGPETLYLTISEYDSDIWVMDLDW